MFTIRKLMMLLSFFSSQVKCARAECRTDFRLRIRKTSIPDCLNLFAPNSMETHLIEKSGLNEDNWIKYADAMMEVYIFKYLESIGWEYEKIDKDMNKMHPSNIFIEYRIKFPEWER